MVRVLPHDRFEREGDDLIWVQPIAFAQAALGSTIEIGTLEGTTALELAAGTQHGSIFRIENEGVPNLRTRKRGDLVVIVQLVVPSTLDEKQRKILEEYAVLEEIPVSNPEPTFWSKLKDKMTGG